MIMLIRFLVLAVCFSFASVGFAGADEGKSESPDYMEPYTGSAEFERIKSLEGKWEGTSIMHGKEVPVSVIYKTTSGGSVVVETLFPDTPHEMVSVYFEDGGMFFHRLTFIIRGPFLNHRVFIINGEYQRMHMPVFFLIQICTTDIIKD